MKHSEPPELLPSAEPDLPTEEIPIDELVGKVYEAAPPTLKTRLLEQLLRPLGVLSLVVLADGIFAKIRFRGGWPDMHVRLEEVASVQARDVIILVNRVQQVSLEALDGLAQIIAASPMMASSAAAAVLVTLLLKRARTRRDSDREFGPSSAKPI